MENNPKWIIFFEDIQSTDLALVGGKGANLGLLTQNNQPIPPKFGVKIQ